MTRYKEVYEQMVKQNKKLFADFKKLHDEYALDPDNLQDKYNQKGLKVQEVIRKYEDILCGYSERSGYGSYTAGLAEKFKDEIRKHFPKIDYLGIKVTNSSVSSFNLKKINLS